MPGWQKIHQKQTSTTGTTNHLLLLLRQKTHKLRLYEITSH